MSLCDLFYWTHGTQTTGTNSIWTIRFQYALEDVVHDDLQTTKTYCKFGIKYFVLVIETECN